MSVRWGRRGALAVGLIVTLALLAACAGGGSSGGSNTAAKEPIKIGMALGLSGYLAQFDVGIQAGAKQAVEAINADGGLLGRNVELVILDMQSDPQQGLQAVQKLITREQVVATVNGFSSAATAATSPVAASSKIPMVVASILPQDYAEWVYATLPPAQFETGVRISYVASAGVKSVGVLYDSTPYAETQLNLAKKQLAEAGIQLVGAEKHAADVTDLRSQLTTLLDKKAGAILKFGGGPSNIVAAKALKQMGSNLPLLMSIDDLSIYRQAAAEYPNVMFAAAKAQVYDELSTAERPPALTSFVDQWRKNNGDKDPTFPARGWDGVFIIASAIKKAGSTDGEKIRAAAETMGKYEGTSTTYVFTKEDHYGQNENPMVLAKFDGKTVKIVYKPK